MKYRLLALAALLAVPITAPVQASSLDDARQTCQAYLGIQHWGATIHAAAEAGDYVMCEAHDRYTGNVLLFRRFSGTYQLAGSSKGGWLSAAEWNAIWHVPLPIAQALTASIQQQLQRNGSWRAYQ